MRREVAGADVNFDIDWVREQFALPENVAFFDNAGGSFTLHSVIERVARYMRESPIQLGGLHRLSQHAADRQRRALESIAHLLACECEELITGPSSSALISRLARALAHEFGPGDEIIVTNFDHESNISPWLGLAERGVKIRFWELNADTRAPELGDFTELLNERTRFVACTQATNILGGILPVEEVCARAHEVGARVLIDGVAYAPHRRVNVGRVDADFYVVSLYKVFGPHLGVMYARRGHLDRLANINLAHLGADSGPYKLQPGGACYELVYGASAIALYWEELGARSGRKAPSHIRAASNAIADYEEALGKVLLDALDELPGVRLLGPTSADRDARLPIYAFTVDDHSSEAVVRALDERGVAVKHGHFHAPRLLNALGIDPAQGVVRASMAHYNTFEEVQRLVRGLRQLTDA